MIILATKRNESLQFWCCSKSNPAFHCHSCDVEHFKSPVHDVVFVSHSVRKTISLPTFSSRNPLEGGLSLEFHLSEKKSSWKVDFTTRISSRTLRGIHSMGRASKPNPCQRELLFDFPPWWILSGWACGWLLHMLTLCHGCSATWEGRFRSYKSTRP
jgi:hypothetical protein